MSCEDCEFPKRISWTDEYDMSWGLVVWSYGVADEVIGTLVARFGEDFKYSVESARGPRNENVKELQDRWEIPS